jgi:hypothetical protein
VSPGQREASDVVIELSVLPADIGMTGLAVGGKPSRSMIRIRRSIKVCCMTAETVGSRSLKLSAHMARRTLHRSMGAAQRESSRGVVIETRVTPLRQAVTALAGCGEICAAMVDRPGVLIILGVASSARGI